MDSMINFFSSYSWFHHHGSNIQYFSSKLQMKQFKRDLKLIYWPNLSWFKIGQDYSVQD